MSYAPSRPVQFAVDCCLGLENAIVEQAERVAVPFTYFAFGFVFFFFGLQKVVPGVVPPVAPPVEAFAAAFGVPLAVAAPFIGVYEMSLGLLFFARRLRLAFLPFLGHQLVAFLPLVVIPYVAFQPPYLDVFGLQVPWAVDWFAAFILKNLVFVGAFFLLASREFAAE